MTFSHRRDCDPELSSARFSMCLEVMRREFDFSDLVPGPSTLAPLQME